MGNHEELKYARSGCFLMAFLILAGIMVPILGAKYVASMEPTPSIGFMEMNFQRIEGEVRDLKQRVEKLESK
jgi:hypothetical protein